jgi:hypothetical protein
MAGSPDFLDEVVGRIGGAPSGGEGFICRSGIRPMAAAQGGVTAVA